MGLADEAEAQKRAVAEYQSRLADKATRIQNELRDLGLEFSGECERHRLRATAIYDFVHEHHPIIHDVIAPLPRRFGWSFEVSGNDESGPRGGLYAVVRETGLIGRVEPGETLKPRQQRPLFSAKPFYPKEPFLGWKATIEVTEDSVAAVRASMITFLSSLKS